VESNYRFRSEQFKHIYLTYYYKGPVTDMTDLVDDPDDNLKLLFKCSLDSKAYINDYFVQAESLIKQSYTRTLIPAQYAKAITSQCASVNTNKLLKMYNPLCEQGYELCNNNRVMVRVVDDNQLETIQLQNLLLPYDHRYNFFSPISERLMEKYGYLSSFEKNTVKDHRKSNSWSYCN
jgi:hypothetical protein